MSGTHKCPRCGTALVRGLTGAHKVCFDCPVCGGRQITTAVLRQALGNVGVAALTRVARESEHLGCVCPECGTQMRLAKVGIDGRKVMIDICGSCLSVWCDHGEFEALVPKNEPVPEKKTLARLARQASPEARERLARSMLDHIPESIDLEDFNVGDVLMDVVRLVAGAPTLWRTVRLATPVFSILLLMALPIMHSVIFSVSRGVDGTFGGYCRGGRDFALIDAGMVAYGYAMSSFKTLFSFPFVQGSGFMSILLVMLLFPLFVTIERRSGHRVFLSLLMLSWTGAVVTHSALLLLGLASGSLCGISPVAFGFAGFALPVWRDVSLRKTINVRPTTGQWISIPVVLPFEFFALGAALGSLLLGTLGTSAIETATVDFWTNIVCAIVGACYGAIVKGGRCSSAA